MLENIEMGQFDELESSIALILCHHETIFSPVFFNMVHLPIYIAEEANLTWLVLPLDLPIQRYGYTSFNYQPFSVMTKCTLYVGLMNLCDTYRYLKSYVDNRTHPEGLTAVLFGLSA